MSYLLQITVLLLLGLRQFGGISLSKTKNDFSTTRTSMDVQSSVINDVATSVPNEVEFEHHGVSDPYATSSGFQATSDLDTTASGFQTTSEQDATSSGFQTTSEQDATSSGFQATSEQDTTSSGFQTTSEQDTTSSGFQTTSELDTMASGFQATSELDTTASGFQATSELDTTASGFQTTSELDTTSSGFQTTSELDTTSSGFQTTSGLDTTASGFQATSDLDTTASGFQTTSELVTTSSGFQTTSELVTTSSGFQTTSELVTTSSGFQTTSEMVTTSSGFQTTSEMVTTSSGFQTTSELDTTSSGFLKPADLNTTSSGFLNTSNPNTTSSSSVDDIYYLPCDKKSEFFQIVCITPMSGVVETRNWNEELPYMPYDVKYFFEVDVPFDHEAMLSFSHLYVKKDEVDCHAISITLYANNINESLQFSNACYRRSPQLYLIYKIVVNYMANGAIRGIWFRLYFSFHNYTALPQILSYDTWNCSAPYWADFQRHLHCNLQVECPDSRDEADCSYTSEFCGTGYIKVGHLCLMYSRTWYPLTWEDAFSKCCRRGGRLPSLSTFNVWRDLYKFSMTHWFKYIFVELQKAPSALPRVTSLRNTPRFLADSLKVVVQSKATMVFEVTLSVFEYRNVFQWNDGSIAYFLRAKTFTENTNCSAFMMNGEIMVSEGFCKNRIIPFLLCQKDDKVEDIKIIDKLPSLMFSKESWPSNVSLVECPESHMTHSVLACDSASACWAQGVSSHYCSAPLTPLPPVFTCDNHMQYVSYILLCDHRIDCQDASDETFCGWPKDRLYGPPQSLSKEIDCRLQSSIYYKREPPLTRVRNLLWYSAPPPAVVNFDSNYTLYFTAFSDPTNRSRCPNSHFHCISNGYCLPVFLRCNGVSDCPQKTDEIHCENYTCTGFYRCRGSKVCVHPDHFCDGLRQCPQSDDEWFCHFHCPEECTCYGLAFYCSQFFPVHAYSTLKYLNARGSMLKPSDLQYNRDLIYLNLALNDLTNLTGFRMLFLRTLDVGDNKIRSIQTSDLDAINTLREFYLSGNPFVQNFIVQDTVQYFEMQTLQVLKLTRISNLMFNTSVVSLFPNLRTLNLSFCNFEKIDEAGFRFLSKLEVIDLRGSGVHIFPHDVFSGLFKLRLVYASDFRLCCPDILPQGFNVFGCHAPTDEISSCDDLLRSNFYRILLFVFSGLTLMGNLGSFFLRTCCASSKSLGFGTLVTHLCVSDFLMGVYLLIIGIADQIYRGNFVSKNVAWKHSAACKTAGILSLLSSEVSAFIICLITYDRFVALRFPFSQFHFSRWSAHMACAAVWTLGLLLAAVPLLPIAAHWEFYSQTSICIPLPITRHKFPGQRYSFGVMIVVNFVLFMVIGLGQLSIYWSIKSNMSSPASSSSSSIGKLHKDLTIAQRLITIAVSDFLCWFPIGLLGLLASSGIPISGEVNVLLAIMVLPLNPAINPYLYTFNTIRERRRQAEEERQKRLAAFQRMDNAVMKNRTR